MSESLLSPCEDPSWDDAHENSAHVSSASVRSHICVPSTEKRRAAEENGVGRQEALLFFSSSATGQALGKRQGTGWRKPQLTAEGADIPVGKQRKPKNRSTGAQAGCLRGHKLGERG